MVVAESFLSFGVEKVWDLLVREYDRFKGVDEQLAELKNDLQLLMSFLKDADTKKHAYETVKSCVEQIGEITFDTEDIIVTFLLKEELRKSSGIRRMQKLPNKWKFALAMESMSKRISNVIARMMTFQVQQMNINDRQDIQSLEEKLREIRETFPSNNDLDARYYLLLATS